MNDCKSCFKYLDALLHTAFAVSLTAPQQSIGMAPLGYRLAHQPCIRHSVCKIDKKNHRGPAARQEIETGIPWVSAADLLWADGSVTEFPGFEIDAGFGMTVVVFMIGGLATVLIEENFADLLADRSGNILTQHTAKKWQRQKTARSSMLEAGMETVQT
jgi:hypothetical protein